MKIFKDAFNGDEYTSDSLPIKTLFDGHILEVETKVITRSVGEVNIGANASAEGEDGDEGADDSAQTVNNMQDNHKLTETSYDKKAYLGHIKAYLKRVADRLKEDGKDVASFQKNAQEFVKGVVAKFDDYQFYTGESMDPEAMVLLKFYKEDGIIPYFYVWRDGCTEVKY